MSGEFEVRDNEGSSDIFKATATTTPASYPASPGNKISGFSITNGLQDIDLSWDGFTSFITIPRRGFYSLNLKGEPTQISVRTSTGTSAFELILNRENY